MLKCALLITLIVAVAVEAKSSKKGKGKGKWKLAWSDDFKGSSVDTSKWLVQNQYCGYPAEMEAYMASNTWVSNGFLYLEARSGTQSCDYYGTRYDKPYTSGQVTSRFLYSQKEGKFEVRAKLPRGKGMWPAIWLMPANKDSCWPTSGEIDIMENIGQDMKAWYSTYHYGPKCNNQPGYNDAVDHGSSTQWNPTDFDLSADFHTWTLEWKGTTMVWSIDGRAVKTLKEGEKDPKTGIAMKFPNEPFGFILNLAWW